MSVIDESVGTESGRRVAYAQLGRLDGTPLFFFHGVPGSRLDFDQPVFRAALDEAGVRLIGIDRPGFGRSTHQVGRRAIGRPMSSRLPTSLVSTGSASLLTPSAVRTQLPAPWRFRKG